MRIEDKELIEQAARATGILGGFCDDRFLCTNNSGGLTQWNPLDSNADCAQMEAELEIDIEWSWVNTDGFVTASNRKHDGARELYATDKAAARRRASTRVAAQIPV